MISSTPTAIGSTASELRCDCSETRRLSAAVFAGGERPSCVAACGAADRFETDCPSQSKPRVVRPTFRNMAQTADCKMARG